MNKQDPQLGEWLASMGVSQQFSSQDLESGRTVTSILRAIDRDCKIQLQEGSSAINRVSNWNAIVEYIKRLGIKMTQEEKSKIINGNHDLVFKIISKLRENHQRSAKETEINLKDIDPKKETKDADSLLQLFLLGIIKNFSLSPKQALSLLSNDGKYLAHILAKGLKGDFRPIDAFIQDLSRNLSKILAFSKNKQNQLFFFKSIKPSLISKSESVAENTLNLISSYLSTYQPPTRINLIKEHLTPTLMLVLRRHPQLTDKVIQNTLELANYNEGIVTDMIDSISKSDLNALFVSLWRVFSQTNQRKALAANPGFPKLIDNINQNLKEPESVLSSLGCCLQMASSDFQIFDKYCGDSLVESIRQISFSKESQNLELIHILFALLSITGEHKYPLAPTIFKMLTSRLINAGDSEYDAIITGMIQLLTELPTIPVLPIIEMLIQRSEMSIGQLELTVFAKMLAGGAEAKVGVAIYNLASRSFVQETGIGRQLALLLINIVSAFRDEQILLDMTVKLIKVCLAMYFASIKKLTEKRKPLSHKTKMEGEEATNRLKLMQIEYFLRRAIQLGQKDINNNIEPLLCFSYLQISAIGKQHSKALEQIISQLGDPQKLINKYEKQFDLDANHNKSRIKNQSKSPQISRSPEGEDLTGTENASNLIKSSQRRSFSSHPLHPMSLSLTGVKQDAYLGLEKYAKRHQVKKLAQQSIRYQKIQVEEDQNKLKNEYKRKMVLQKGLKFRGVSEDKLHYIFQFDTKEVYAESNHLYMNFYVPDAEEERDAQGVEQFIRRYQKLLRVYFIMYSGKKHGYHTKLFDQISDISNFVHASSIVRLVKDHGLENFITPKEIQVIARRVNYRQNNVKYDPQLLDFEGFKELMIQMSFTMFTRPPNDMRGRPVAEMLGQLISTLKLYASENKVSGQLFAEPEACFTGEQEAIKLLNRRLTQNPDYILPQGYKKITQNRVFFDYKIYLQALSPTHKEVIEVLDEILFEHFKFHIIEPFIKEQKICRARPNVYALERNKLTQIDVRHLPVYLKKQVAKFPIKQRIIAKDAAFAIADILQAIDYNHDEIGIKHQNPIIKGKKQKEEQLKRIRQQEERKRKLVERQLKTSMESYKEVRQSEKQKKQKQKTDQIERKREEKDKREKRQKQLKQKLQEYNQRKKQDEEAKKASEQSKQQKEKQEAERKKRELDEAKRKIEEIKKQKQKQQKDKKQREQQEKKRKKEDERQKFQRTQKQKKQKIEQYKEKKKGNISKVIDSPNNEDN